MAGERIDGGPRSLIVVAASWGNAGWVAPGLAIPLNEPTVLRYGLRSLLNPTAPLHVPMKADPGLWPRRRSKHRSPLRSEPRRKPAVCWANCAGWPMRGRRSTTGSSIAIGCASSCPSPATPAAGVRIEGQHYLDPGDFVRAPARAVIARGAAVYTVDVRINGVTVHGRHGRRLSVDAAVVATGALRCMGRSAPGRSGWLSRSPASSRRNVWRTPWPAPARSACG
jgi:D-amino-acid dehydrogenase